MTPQEQATIAGIPVRIGDVFSVEKSYGNGVRRFERWTVESHNPRGRGFAGSCKLTVAFDRDGWEETLKRRETVPVAFLAKWAKEGRRLEQGEGETVFLIGTEAA